MLNELRTVVASTIVGSLAGAVIGGGLRVDYKLGEGMSLKSETSSTWLLDLVCPRIPSSEQCLFKFADGSTGTGNCPAKREWTTCHLNTTMLGAALGCAFGLGKIIERTMARRSPHGFLRNTAHMRAN